MNRYFAAFLAIVPSIGAAQQPKGMFAAPVTAKHQHVTTIHGQTRSDDYFWLRKKGDPEVVRHLVAETTYTAAMMKPTVGLQKTMYEEMLKRIKQTDTTASHREGDYDYYSRTEEGKQYPVFLRRRVGGGAPQVVIDQNELAKGHGFYAIGSFEVSDDGNLLAFSVDTTGYRQYALRVKDLRTGRILADVVPRVTSVTWATDNKTLSSPPRTRSRSGRTSSGGIVSATPRRRSCTTRRTSCSTCTQAARATKRW